MAYEDILPELSIRYQEYLESLRALGKPSTDQEVCNYACHNDPNYFRPRRNELVKLGLINEVGKRECKISGKTALIWWFL
jgi:hypothetical protein